MSSEAEKRTLNRLRQKARNQHPPACHQNEHCTCGIRQAENQRIAERNNPFTPWRTPQPRQSAAEEQADQMSTDPTRNGR